MRKIRLLPVMLFLLLLAPLSLAQVNVDYDQDFAWGSVKSYAWKETPETNVDDLAHKRIVEVVERYLMEFGVTVDSSDPDVWVTYHGSTQDEVAVDVDSWGYGYPSSMYWGPYSRGYYSRPIDTTATTRHYTVGTLVIDVLDADTLQLIWRGTARDTIPDKTKKREKTLNRAVAKMVKEWESLRKKQKRKEKG